MVGDRLIMSFFLGTQPVATGGCEPCNDRQSLNVVSMIFILIAIAIGKWCLFGFIFMLATDLFYSYFYFYYIVKLPRIVHYVLCHLV